MSFSQSNFYSEFSSLSIHRKFYIIGLVILALGMPLSPILISISQFILFGTWLIEGNFKSKFLQIKSNSSLWAFLLLPLLHLLWLFNTTNFDYALHDLKIKIPLLLFPLVLGTIPPISTKSYDGFYTLLYLAFYLELLPVLLFWLEFIHKNTMIFVPYQFLFRTFDLV